MLPYSCDCQGHRNHGLNRYATKKCKTIWVFQVKSNEAKGHRYSNEQDIVVYNGSRSLPHPFPPTRFYPAKNLEDIGNIDPCGIPLPREEIFVFAVKHYHCSGCYERNSTQKGKTILESQVKAQESERNRNYHKKHVVVGHEI